MGKAEAAIHQPHPHMLANTLGTFDVRVADEVSVAPAIAWGRPVSNPLPIIQALHDMPTFLHGSVPRMLNCTATLKPV